MMPKMTTANERILELLGLQDKSIMSIKIEFYPDAFPTVTVVMLPDDSELEKILNYVKELNFTSQKG